MLVFRKTAHCAMTSQDIMMLQRFKVFRKRSECKREKLLELIKLCYFTCNTDWINDGVVLWPVIMQEFRQSGLIIELCTVMSSYGMEIV